MTRLKTKDGVQYKKVYARYIRRADGRIIYPKTAKAFCFWVKA